jgi:hypothetical protein
VSARAYAEPAPLTAPQKLGLVGEIAIAYVRVRRRLRNGGLRDTLVAVRSSPPAALRDPERALPEGMRLAWAVRRTLPLLPADSRCLMRSLVLMALLDRRDIGSSLVIGVRPGERFGAHAWVELGGRPLLPRGESEFERFVEL